MCVWKIGHGLSVLLPLLALAPISRLGYALTDLNLLDYSAAAVSVQHKTSCHQGAGCAYPNILAMNPEDYTDGKTRLQGSSSALECGESGEKSAAALCEGYALARSENLAVPRGKKVVADRGEDRVIARGDDFAAAHGECRPATHDRSSGGATGIVVDSKDTIV